MAVMGWREAARITAHVGLLLLMAVSGAGQPRPSENDLESIRQKLEHANQLVRHGDCQSAIPHYRDILSRLPDFGSVYNMLGLCYTQRNELQLANQVFRKAVQLEPESIEFRNNLGANHLTQNQISDAIEQFQVVIKHNPQNVGALFNLGVAELRDNRWQEAQSHLHRAWLLAPTDTQIAVQLIELYLRLEKPDLAENVLETAKPVISGDPAVQFTLGVVFARNRRVETASALIRSASQSIPDVEQRILALAIEHHEQGKFAVVVDLLSTLGENKVENSAVWHGLLGNTLYRLDRIEEAAKHLQRAIRLHPTNEEYYLDLGEIFGANNAYKAAIALFEGGVKALPDSKRLRFALALSHQLDGDQEKSSEILKNVIQDDPLFVPAYKLLADNYDYAGKWESLLETAQHMRRLDKENYWSWHFEAKAQFQMARRLPEPDFDKADLALAKAISLRPKGSENYFLLGKIRSEQGRHHEAIEALAQAVQIDPEHAPSHYLLGQTYKRVGEQALSQKEFATHKRLMNQKKTRTVRKLLVDVRP